MEISLCIICKNEETRIKRCITNVKKIVDEIIVVDTGSTDNTLDIVKSLGVSLYEIEWENNFSKARNYAIDKATRDWIIFLDADEYFTQESVGLIKQFILEAQAKKADYVLSEILNEGEEGYRESAKVIRIFKRSKNIYYIHTIHERLQKRKGELQGIDASEALRIIHDGYLKSVVQGKDKIKRNEELLLEKLKKQPNNGETHFYLVQVYMFYKEFEKAKYHAQRVFKDENVKLLGVYEATYSYLLKICCMLEESVEIIEYYYQKSVKQNKSFPDFDYYIGVYYVNKSSYEKGVDYLEECLNKIQRYRGYEMCETVAKVEKILEIISQCYLMLGDERKAITKLIQILRINPYHYAALFNLVNIIQKQEPGKTIGEFLGQLYDLTQEKDQLILLKVSQEIKNQELYSYLWNLASEEVKNAMSN